MGERFHLGTDLFLLFFTLIYIVIQLFKSTDKLLHDFDILHQNISRLFAHLFSMMQGLFECGDRLAHHIDATFLRMNRSHEGLRGFMQGLSAVVCALCDGRDT